jgi:hypothetical protein
MRTIKSSGSVYRLGERGKRKKTVKQKITPEQVAEYNKRFDDLLTTMEQLRKDLRARGV